MLTHCLGLTFSSALSSQILALICLLLMKDYGQGTVLGHGVGLGGDKGLSGMALSPLKGSQALKRPCIRPPPRVCRCEHGCGVYEYVVQSIIVRIC